MKIDKYLQKALMRRTKTYMLRAVAFRDMVVDVYELKISKKLSCFAPLPES